MGRAKVGSARTFAPLMPMCGLRPNEAFLTRAAMPGGSPGLQHASSVPFVQQLELWGSIQRTIRKGPRKSCTLRSTSAEFLSGDGAGGALEAWGAAHTEAQVDARVLLQARGVLGCMDECN